MGKWCWFCEQLGVRRIAYRVLADGRGMCGGCLADVVWIPMAEMCQVHEKAGIKKVAWYKVGPREIPMCGDCKDGVPIDTAFKSPEPPPKPVDPLSLRSPRPKILKGRNR